MSSMTYMLGIWMFGSAALFCLGALVGARLQRMEYARRWKKIEGELDLLGQQRSVYR